MSLNPVLIFGSTGGIGMAITKTLLENNAHVCAVHHHPDGRLRLEKEMQSERISFHRMDLSNEESVAGEMAHICKEYQHIPAVVFSVSAPIVNKPILRSTWDDYATHINIQMKALVAIISAMKEQIQSGKKIRFVIVLSDVCIGAPPSGMSAYTAAKYALMGLAKSMAVEFSQYGCTVTMVSPGMVDTDLISNFPPKLVELTAQKNPLKRIATPQDVANVVCFLLGEGGEYLNGANIPVNGGGNMA